jgi:hypothetical protein
MRTMIPGTRPFELGHLGDEAIEGALEGWMQEHSPAVPSIEGAGHRVGWGRTGVPV